MLSFWFPEEDLLTADAETLQRQVRWWMRGGPEVDREIVERFGGVLEQARRGVLDHWAETPRGRLALIVVLDQFSRNAYRGSALSYAQDEKALRLAVEGIGVGMDRELRPMERDFFWMPPPRGRGAQQCTTGPGLTGDDGRVHLLVYDAGHFGPFCVRHAPWRFRRDPRSVIRSV